MKAIGIDIGTTSVCGVLIEAKSGKLLRSVTKNSNAFLPGRADFEKIQSVDTVISTATAILEELLDGDVAVIGVTGQMHGIVYTDRDGRAVSPLYTWQDGRGNLPYKDTTYAKHLGSYSGYGHVTDFYNRENGLVPETAISYCTVYDYLVMRLCGLKAPILHASSAASFGCYNFEKNESFYPYSAEITADYRIAGTYRGVPIAIGIGDNQASVFSTLTDEGAILLNVGTGSQVSVITETPITAAGIETRPYFEGKYLAVGSALCGGRAYSLLKSFYAKIFSYLSPADDETVYTVMSKMLEDETDAPLTVDTRFAGTREDTALCGSISGIKTENFTPSALTRGVLSGMAGELATLYRHMGVTRHGIVGSGNGIRKNEALVRAFEQAFGAKMSFPTHLEEASFGAALFGLIARGVFSSAAEAQKIITHKGAY